MNIDYLMGIGGGAGIMILIFICIWAVLLFLLPLFVYGIRSDTRKMMNLNKRIVEQNDAIIFHLSNYVKLKRGKWKITKKVSPPPGRIINEDIRLRKRSGSKKRKGSDNYNLNNWMGVDEL